MSEQTKTKLKKKKIAASIRKDAQLDGKYLDHHGHYCVVGGLLKHAGYQMRKLVPVNQSGVGDLPEDATELLEEVYGLTYDHLLNLQQSNDSVVTEHYKTRAEATKFRRRALLKILKELY